MNVRPLIVRELRAEARRPGSYWVRCVAAGILTALFVWSVWNYGGNPNSLGRDLFGALSQGMVLGVSALTSDSISREKREGTIGLLFLTPLNAREIVVGKALLHGLRALVIFLAMLPIIAMPFLLGGIPIQAVVENFLTLGIAFCYALTAGIIASVYNTQWIQAMVWGVILATIQFAGFVYLLIALALGRDRSVDVVTFLINASLAIGFPVALLNSELRWNWRRPIVLGLATGPFMTLGLLIFVLPFGQWVSVAAMAPILLCFLVMGKKVAILCREKWFQRLVWLQIIFGGQFLAFLICRALRSGSAGWDEAVNEGVVLLIAIVQLTFSALLAGVVLKRNWDDDSEMDREPVWVQFFSASGFWRGAFRWDTRRARDRNPIAWLQEYNWTSRLTKWGWCALLFLAEMRMLLQFRRYIDYQMQLYYLTAMGIAFSAAASFRRERQTGALELLLVTPVSARQLIWGRLQGVWFHFLPAMAILATVWAMGPQWISLPIRFMCYLVGAYFCIPVIGFYCSMLTANVLVSWLLTLFFGLLLPYAGTEAFRWEIGRRNLPVAFFAIQLVFGLIAAGLLYENLARRRFALQRA